MDLRNEDLPVTLQAFELVDNKEIFIAEQVVNTQGEIDTFTNRFVGKVIKAKKATVQQNNAYGEAVVKKRNPTTGFIMIIVILVILALVIYGFSTGWIQEKFHMNI